jgi:hypothetical protein
MDRQKRFLHYVLDIRIAEPGAGESASRHGADLAANLFKQAAIDLIVAGQRGAHHDRPFLVALAFAHGGVSPSFGAQSEMLRATTDFYAQIADRAPSRTKFESTCNMRLLGGEITGKPGHRALKGIVNVRLAL